MNLTRCFRWLSQGLFCLTACLCLSALAHAAPTEQVEKLLGQVYVKPVLDSGEFTVNEVTFQRLTIPRYVTDRYADAELVVLPGESHDLVREIKLDLYSNVNYPNNEFVTYSQVRPPNTKDDIDADYWIDGDDYEDVLYYFDDHLKILIDTLYQFCGLDEKEPCLDALTCYLLEQLPSVSLEMRQDIERVYKYNLIQAGSQGTIGRDGQPDGLYYFAQTDPDWANMIFEYNENGDTIRDRGCGCACASMIISTYWNVEITPRWTRTIALDGEWPVDYGLPNDYFSDVASKYSYYARYDASLYQPKTLLKSEGEVNMDELARLVGEEGYMAIIHVVKGAFTSHEHYMVLADYEEIDGKGYFLVADPYELQSRYSSWDQLKQVDSANEGLIYATKEVLYRDCKSIILFEQDRNSFPLFSKRTAPETLLKV